ncbi:MAG: type II toxin-antitoxin system RelE/ParE family toxin [Dehalococcoidia bacterium]|nr:type II toxin-antitoxin system RelE/ParE family toxin [Dehalococcoidia bacterium]
MPEPFRLDYRRKAFEELQGLPKADQQRVRRRIGELRSDPRPPGSEKYKGDEHTWKIRVGNYRILYVIDFQQRLVSITRVAYGHAAYRRF